MSPLALTKPVPSAPGQGPEDDVHLTLRDHLIELRKRLKWALLFLALGFGASWNWSKELFHFLMLPVFAALPDGEKELHYSSGVDPLFIYLKVALYAGLFVSLPFILWQIWAFVAPGLYRKERR
ncbi:MAG TPA: twin-arginine translocase subunit TatC, partial [Myxococcales bacterium]|nr:twin-arginine translocase subunit TatC [Myxococcales bacterium]